MKRIKIIVSVALLLVALGGCGTQKPQNNDNQSNSTSEATADNENDTKDNNDHVQKDESKTSDAAGKNKKDDNKKINDEGKSSVGSKDSSKTSDSDNGVKEKVIDYIVNGQENKPEAQKLKWSKTFLNKVDVDALYKQYKEDGGKAGDIEKFASYMTQNAPTLNDWKELFKKDLYDTYGEKVVKIEHLKDDSYQAYIEKDSSEVPFVVVSAVTGYFHG